MLTYCRRRLALFLALGLPVALQAAALSDEDDRLLTDNLRALSKAWVQQAVDSSNGILWKPEYTRRHWQRFFSAYFEANPFTEDLRNYLSYPVFGWGPEAAHAELQEGLAASLQELQDRLLRQHAGRLGAALNRDDALLQTLCKATRFVNYLAASRDTSRKTKDRLYRFHLEQIARYKAFPASYSIDITRYPYLGRIRGQLYMNLVSLALPEAADPKARTLRTVPRETRDEMARAIALRGQRLETWQKHAVLIIDNGGLDSKQLSAVNRLLELVPPALHNLGVITVEEFLGKKVDWFDCAVGCVNIGGVRVGAVQENGFPPDVSPLDSDLFCLIWAHEFNHVVDYYGVSHDNPHRKRLLEQAGEPARNYLRSMFSDGVFVKGPQEFFASISNQYFASSQHTLDLGLARFRQGYREPLNQFLFFADVYSLKGESTLFFTMDARGRIERTSVPLTRDRNGFIDSLQATRKLYRFTRDENGNVTECETK